MERKADELTSANTTQIHHQERDMLFAGIVALGGRISRRLTERCTHLLTHAPASSVPHPIEAIDN